ncbi:MAG: sugar-binding domain-containing protein, partial [Bacteroidota bacterium]
MMRTRLLSFVLLSKLSLLTQPWQIQPAPLMSPWAEQVDPSAVLSEYPRPMMSRPDWQSLNGIWAFGEASKGAPLPIKGKIPEEILVPFAWESALSGIRRQLKSQRAFYRRSFEISEDWEGKRVLLHFGAVDWEASVYLNGRCVGMHQGGYDAFSFEITDYLTEKGEQQLIVEVYDPGNDEAIAVGKQNNDRFADPQRYAYAPVSGIWQSVWLEAVPEHYITDLHTVPHLFEERLSLTANTSPRLPANTKIRAEILSEAKVIPSKEGLPNREWFIDLPDPQAWSPENPFLYDLRLSLVSESGQVFDEVGSYFGMRDLSLIKQGGLQQLALNGKFLFQMGPLDQGYWPDGLYTAPSDEALRWEVEQMKKWGFNMVRKHIKIEPQRWYYWCDKLGLLVWQDMPSTFQRRSEAEKEQFELELGRMLRTHWNHPSIVNWIVFNEHWGLYEPIRLTEWVMAMDPSRWVTGNSGIDAGKPDIDYVVGHIKDNHSYRPPSVPFANSQRAVVNGEYGAIGYKIPAHIWDVDGPWVHHNYEGKEAATTEY